jgi:hypothetical protein
MQIFTRNFWHRHFRFRVKTLLLVMSGCCVVALWFHFRVQYVHNQARVCKYFKSLGCTAETSNGIVRCVQCANQLDEEAFAELPNLTGLEVLILTNQSISDETVKIVGDLSVLEALSLSSTNLTDTGFRHLTNLRNVTHLRLDGTLITDQALKMMETMDQLRFVDLRRTKITQAGLIRFRQRRPNTEVSF